MLETGVGSSRLLTQREKVCRGRWALGKPLLQASGVQEDVRGTAGVVAGGPAAQGTRTSLPTAPSPVPELSSVSFMVPNVQSGLFPSPLFLAFCGSSAITEMPAS